MKNCKRSRLVLDRRTVRPLAALDLVAVRSPVDGSISGVSTSRERSERIQLPSSLYASSWLLYVFDHADVRRTVWLHEIDSGSEAIYGAGYTWRCSCGANSAGVARPLTVELLRSAWSHFDAHVDPSAVALRSAAARWDRGGQDPDLDELLERERARILGREPELE